jgi:hypothetical protein
VYEFCIYDFQSFFLRLFVTAAIDNNVTCDFRFCNIRFGQYVTERFGQNWTVCDRKVWTELDSM